VGRVRRLPDAAAELSRRALLADLETYAPANEREAAMLSQLRAFVAEYDDCFERTLAIGHVTGSAWVIDPAGDAALLTHHRKLGKWLQLGGHADGDPDIRGVARREALEESGLAHVMLASDAIYDVDVHEIVRFAFYADRGDVPIASEESHAVAWVPLAEIERFTIDDSVRRLVAKTPALISASAR
jgi:8-oxo-dGTP pyrophosphatase MutT (NUDIX family)